MEKELQLTFVTEKKNMTIATKNSTFNYETLASKLALLYEGR